MRSDPSATFLPRIALVTGTLQLGGSTTFLLNLAGELAQRGVSCHVFGDGPFHPLANDFERLGIPVSVENPRRAIFEDRIEAVLHELREYQPSVVVATLAPFAFEILRYVPNNVLRIAMVQADDPLVYRTVEKYADYISGIAGVSAVIVRRLEKMDAFRGVAKHYLPYGVPIPIKPIEHPRLDEPLRILYLGRINNEQKRVRLFPQILAELQDAGIPFQWTIAGDGPDRAALEAVMRSAAKDEQVKFVGALTYAEVPRQLDLHHIFLLTSDYEGLPLSLLEAMGHGLVPVVTDLESGIGEIVDGGNGVLVKVDDIEGYARGIARLHDNRGELAAKSAAARERVKNKFSVKAMTDRWLSVLRPNQQPVSWPRHFRVRGPITDSRQWKYARVTRWLRRILKFVLGSIEVKTL